MRLLFVFAFLTLICMARSAPTQSSTSRVLIFPDYHAVDDEIIHDEVKPNEDQVHVDVDEDDDEDEKSTTKKAPTTTRRSTFAFPTRNRDLIPSRRPIRTQRTLPVRTTTIAAITDDQDETGNEYDGDFKYIRDFRKYFQQFLEDIKKLVRNLTGYDLVNTPQKQQYDQNEED